MTIKEFYAEVCGDYSGVLERLMTEERIKKYLLKFIESDDYITLEDDINDKNWESAFRDSHNLKGVCLNLGIDKLQRSASELCETMRNGEPVVDIAPLLLRVKKDYYDTVEAIQLLD